MSQAPGESVRATAIQCSGFCPIAGVLISQRFSSIQIFTLRSGSPTLFFHSISYYFILQWFGFLIFLRQNVFYWSYSFNQEEKHSNPFQASHLYENASWETSIKTRGERTQEERKEKEMKEQRRQISVHQQLASGICKVFTVSFFMGSQNRLSSLMVAMWNMLSCLEKLCMTPLLEQTY